MGSLDLLMMKMGPLKDKMLSGRLQLHRRYLFELNESSRIHHARIFMGIERAYRTQIDSVILMFFRRTEFSIITAFLGPLGKIRNTAAVLKEKQIHKTMMILLFDEQTKRKTEEMFDMIEERLNDEIGLKLKENERFETNSFSTVHETFKMLHSNCRREVFLLTLHGLIKKAFEFTEVQIRVIKNQYGQIASVCLKCC